MNRYITIDEIRALQLTPIEDLSDSTINRLINMYSGIVDEYCNTKFVPTTASFHADADKKILMPCRPLIFVESLKYLSMPLKEHEEYCVYKEMGVVMLLEHDTYEKRKRTIEIQYIYGYETVPNTVKRAIVDLICLDRNAVKSNATITAESFEDYSYQKSSKTIEDMKKDILSLLDRFVQPAYVPIINEIGNVKARLF